MDYLHGHEHSEPPVRQTLDGGMMPVDRLVSDTFANATFGVGHHRSNHGPEVGDQVPRYEEIVLRVAIIAGVLYRVVE